MKRILRALIQLRRDERGVALPLAMMALVVLATLSAALLVIGSSEVQIMSNHLRATQALSLAEAGLEDFFNAARNTPSVLASAPLGLTAVSPCSVNPTPPCLAGPGTTLAAYGSYTVRYQRAGTNTVLVETTGTNSIGSAQEVLRATLSNTFTSNDAIRTRGNLRISDNPTVNGSCGSAHTNTNLTISDNPSFTGSATASGTYTGPPGYGPGAQPLKPIPVISPLAFLDAAKALPGSPVYQMKADGWVLDGDDVRLIEQPLLSGQSYRGWKYTAGTPAKWDYDGDIAFDGTYYLEGNAKVSGNPGSLTTPWRTTIIATGDIKIEDNPKFASHLTDTLLVAGLDIKIEDNLVQTSPGLIAAHEQIDISDNPTINGYIIAEDATSTSGTVTENRVSDNPTITYNCGLNPPLTGPLQTLAWGL